MAVNIDDLLALPQKERRKIAEKLWESLHPASSSTIEEKEIIKLLETRWEDIQSGQSKLLSTKDVKEKITIHRSKI